MKVLRCASDEVQYLTLTLIDCDEFEIKAVGKKENSSQKYYELDVALAMFDFKKKLLNLEEDHSYTEKEIIIMSSMNEFEVFKYDIGKYGELKCHKCGCTIKDGDEIYNYKYYTKWESDYDDDWYDDNEVEFCSSECLIDYILNSTNQCKKIKVKLLNSKSEENIKKRNKVLFDLENLKPNQTWNEFGLEVFCFEKDNQCRYMYNDGCVFSNLDRLKRTVIEKLKDMEVII